MGIAFLGACDSSGGTAGTTQDAVVGEDTAADTISGDDTAVADDTAVVDDTAVADDTVADTAGDDTVAPPSCPEGAITVYLYEDGNGASSSWYNQPQGADDVPLTGVSVRLLGAGGEALDALDCGPGRYGFVDVSAGWHQLAVDLDRESTSNNFGRRLPEAIASGAVEMLTFGDSIPHYGPEPWFPEQLTTMMTPLADVDDINVAIPGSQTVDWLPGTSNFNNRIAPHLATADVIVFSLGGNDLMDLAFEANISTIDEALALLDDLDAELAVIEANLVTLYSALRAAAPDADILWFVYPNYAMSDQWAQYIGSYQDLAASLMDGKLAEVRDRMAENDGLMLADMQGSLDKPALDAFLWDELHLNVAGSHYYAEEVFMTLGGVFVDPTAPRGLTRMMGFAP
ncbi:MAG: SGNH/GDSL hydrolase family protein [Deltaproteobacteria bacterium]|nr:MAG: SGNH/GDSL hydrolase family protein [Deltaproteobacteria bacterium]